MTTKTKKSTSKKAAPAKVETGRDRYGASLSSQNAKINAMVSAKPTAIESIVEKTGLRRSRVLAQLKFLVEKGHAKIDDGKVKSL